MASIAKWKTGRPSSVRPKRRLLHCKFTKYWTIIEKNILAFSWYIYIFMSHNSCMFLIPINHEGPHCQPFFLLGSQCYWFPVRMLFRNFLAILILNQTPGFSYRINLEKLLYWWASKTERRTGYNIEVGEPDAKWVPLLNYLFKNNKNTVSLSEMTAYLGCRTRENCETFPVHSLLLYPVWELHIEYVAHYVCL